jgi:hypothetical protein
VKDIRLKPVLITVYLPFYKEKIAVVTNQSGVVLIEDNKENPDNKMQTHLVDFLLAQNQYPQNICTRTWFCGTADGEHCRRNGFYN